MIWHVCSNEPDYLFVNTQTELLFSFAFNLSLKETQPSFPGVPLPAQVTGEEGGNVLLAAAE